MIHFTLSIYFLSHNKLFILGCLKNLNILYHFLLWIRTTSQFNSIIFFLHNMKLLANPIHIYFFPSLLNIYSFFTVASLWSSYYLQSHQLFSTLISSRWLTLYSHISCAKSKWLMYFETEVVL